MLGLDNQQKKLLALALLILILISSVSSALYLARLTTDNRGKASATPLGPIDVILAPHSSSLGEIDSEYSVDIKMDTKSQTSTVTAAAITLSYPKDVLAVDESKTNAQARNTSEECNVLDQSISNATDAVAGVVKMVKATYAAENDLPRGEICFGTVYFKVLKTTLTTPVEIKLAGDVSKISDWDIVGNAGGVTGRFLARLGTPVRLGDNNIAGNVTVAFKNPNVVIAQASQELKVDVLFTSDTPIIGGGITLKYPLETLELDTAKTSKQSLNATPECRILDQELDLLLDGDRVNLVKLSYKPELDLPKGGFCFGTFIFKVKTLQGISGKKIEFGGSLSDRKDWDIVGKSGRMNPILENSVLLTLANVTQTPVSTISPTPNACFPPSLYSCQKLIPGTACETEDKEDGAACRISNDPSKPGMCNAGACNAVTTTPTTSTGVCSRKPEGDSDCNAIINLNDFEIFREEYIKFRRGLLALSQVRSDYNDDGFIDIEDFAVFRETFIQESL